MAPHPAEDPTPDPGHSLLLAAILGLGALAGCGRPPLLQNGPSGCVPLVVSDPAVSMDGIAQFSPEEKMNDPKAGSPMYVYLEAGREAVVLPGPAVPDTAGLFALQSQSIVSSGARTTSVDAYTVTVNPALSYQVAISDFEFEVSLTRVELCRQSGTITSRFVYRANPGAGGVARDITVTGTAHSTMSAPTSPVTVEVR